MRVKCHLESTDRTRREPRAPEVSSARTVRVSVGMPVYNGGAALPSAIESVLNQTEADLELVICDNASTDGSYEVCMEYARLDHRIRLLRNEINAGGNPNYRRVALEARGRYFKWSSANDLIAPDFLERCTAALDEEPGAALAYGRTILFTTAPDEGTEHLDDLDLRGTDPVERFIAVTQRLKLNNVINGVIRRDMLLRTGVMPDYLSSDNVVLAELALHGTFIEVPQTRFYRRMTPSSATSLQSAEEVLKHHYPRLRPGLLFQNWQMTAGYFAAALRAPLTAEQRARALLHCTKLAYWAVPELWRDVSRAATLLRRRARGNY